LLVSETSFTNDPDRTVRPVCNSGPVSISAAFAVQPLNADRAARTLINSTAGWVERDLIMRDQLPISAAAFDALDFSEAVIDFPCPRILSSELNIEVWGVTLLTASRFWPNSLPVPDVSFDATKENIYIAGFSNLRMQGVVGGELTVRLYEFDRSPIVFAKTYDGGYVVLNRSWIAASVNAARTYELHSVLAWPFGECDFVLQSHGSISLDFDLSACVSSRVYSSTPERFLSLARTQTSEQ